jgi:DNA-binding response OmpR family regulator
MRSVAKPERDQPRVLVVDDSASTCLLISSVLQKQGYNVDIALNGQDGLSKIMTFRPNCLILDVLLPDISGYTVCRYIRQRLQQRLYIILISTKGSSLDQHYGLRQGADCYLAKPFSKETFLQVVWQGLPASMRQVVPSSVSYIPSSHPQLWELIPRRVPNTEAMRSSSPFVRSIITGDERARRLFAAIDGKKTVHELSAITSLATNDVSDALRALLLEHYIELYDPAGRLVEIGVGFFKEIM